MTVITKISEFIERKEYNSYSEFAKNLIETAEENTNFHPPHFCIISPGSSSCGGGFYFNSIGERDRKALIEFIGMIEAVKYEALNALDKIEYDF